MQLLLLRNHVLFHNWFRHIHL